jgi:multidrug efflux pump subunit AcrB
MDGQPSVYLPVLKQGGEANTLSVVSGIKSAVAHLLDVPGRLITKVVFDQSVFVKNAIENLIHEGAIGLILTGAMILIFLGSLRATVAVFLSIPLSALAAFIALAAGNHTVNAMVLSGLALAFSRLIDNSVVVLENIFRHLESGETPAVAAERGGQGRAAGASSLPVGLITLKGQDMNEAQLRDFGQYTVRNQVANVPGASVPQPFGGRYRQIMVYVDPLKLQAHQLSVMDVVRSVNDSNLILPAGDVRIGPFDYNLYANSQQLGGGAGEYFPASGNGRAAGSRRGKRGQRSRPAGPGRHACHRRGFLPGDVSVRRQQIPFQRAGGGRGSLVVRFLWDRDDRGTALLREVSDRRTANKSGGAAETILLRRTISRLV